MVQFIFFFQATQNGNGILYRWLFNKNGLEATGKRGIFFDMFAIFIKRRRAHTMQFTTCQRRLQQIGRIHCAICFARADKRMHFINKKDDTAIRRTNFVQHRFKTFFKLTAIFGTGNKRAHVEGQQFLVAETFRYIPVHNPQRQPFSNGCFTDTGFTDQHRIVFCPPGQNLYGAPYFFITPDHRVKPSFARVLSQVTRIFF